jgi:peptide/nickel transport system substrate-binding protein
MDRLVAALTVLGTLALPAAAQTLSLGLPNLPSSLDSADVTDVSSLAVAINVTEPLIGYAADDDALQPRLATSWRPNGDATVWTLTLREGVAFHDGTPFDAEAVRFNLERWNDPDHPQGHRSEGKAYVPWRWVFGGFGEESLLDEVRVVDRHTVDLVLREAIGFLPSLLAAPYFQIDSPAAVRAAGPAYGTRAFGAVGTGPFRFERWDEGERILLVRHDDDWDGSAGVERVAVRGVPEASARLAELQAGTLDIALALAPDSIPRIEARPELSLVTAEAELNVGFLGIHQANPPLDDPRVRRAIVHAIDREALLEAFHAGTATLSVDFLPPTLWGHPDVEPHAYDPDRARALLAEAGHPVGFATELWTYTVADPLFPAPRAMAETIATYLADVGIEAELKTTDFTAYLAERSTGAYPLFLSGWAGDYPDPDTFLYTFFGPARYASYGWDDREVVAWVERARHVADREERAELYHRVLLRVHEAVPAVPLMHASSVHGVRSGVTGFAVGPMGAGYAPLTDVTKRDGRPARRPRGRTGTFRRTAARRPGRPRPGSPPRRSSPSARCRRARGCGRAGTPRTTRLRRRAARGWLRGRRRRSGGHARARLAARGRRRRTPSRAPSGRRCGSDAARS